MIKIALCDDVTEHVASTQQLLTEWSEQKDFSVTVDCYDNGDSLIASLARNHYDIILLDIIMPMLSGIDTAAEIRKTNSSVKIIFLSSSGDFGIQSYTVKASNYLLKPIEPELLFRALDELSQELSNEPETLICKSNRVIQKIPLRSIEYIESQDKYVSISISGKEPVKVLEPLYQLENRLLLSEGFYKCHRSYIVNMRYVNSFNSNEIKMFSGASVPISRKHAKTFQDTYFSYVFEREGR